MRFFLDILRLEWRLQWRSLRFRVGAGVFLLLSCAPPVVTAFFLRPVAPLHFGAASHLAWSLDLARFSGVILAMVVAGQRADRAAQRRAWPVLAAAGVSNGGYLWRRWAAMAVILAVLTAVPPLFCAAVTLFVGLEPAAPAAYAGSWLVLLLPAVLVQSALWLALVTLGGSELAAFLLLFVGLEAAELVSLEVVRPLLLSTLSVDASWLGFDRLQWGLRGFWIASRAAEPSHYLPLLASDGAFDLSQATAWLLHNAAPYAALAVVLLALAAGFLRRTRRDLRPLELGPEHPLRNLSRLVHGARQLYTPDAALRAERWRWALAAGVALAVILGHHERQSRFEDWAAARYAAETATEDQPTTPLAVVPVERRIGGELRADGTLEAETRLRLVNRGEQAVTALAFELDAFVAATVTREGGEVEVERRWDRLFVYPRPPLAAGGDLELVVTARGEPRDVHFQVTSPWGRGHSFAWRYHTYLAEGGHRNRYHDLAASRVRPAISRRRVDLAARDLTPVVRYADWTLTPPPEMEGEFGYRVPPETERPHEAIEVDLQGPAEFFLADACGRFARDDRLRGRCRLPIAAWRLRGAPLEPLATEGRVALAALPGHEAIAETHLAALEEVARLSDEAWPGLGGIETLVAIEWPPAYDVAQQLLDIRALSPMLDLRGGNFEVDGSLISIAEVRVVGREPLASVELVGQLLAAKLLDRRQVVREERVVFRQLLSAAMAQRMGLGAASGATLSGRPWMRSWAAKPLLEGGEAPNPMAAKKAAALVVELMARVGRTDFYAAVEDFLGAGTAPAPEKEAAPGRLQELFEALERRSGADLGRFWEQYFAAGGKALPQLRLAEVTVEARGDDFVVSGQVYNDGSGEARCPVVVQGEGQTRSTRVTVGPESGTAFEIVTERRPHTAVLDPEKTCFRWVTPGAPAAERVALAAAGRAGGR